MDAEEKRTEKNLIVRSGISEAEISNNKRLRSTFCIEAIQYEASRGLFATAELFVVAGFVLILSLIRTKLNSSLRVCLSEKHQDFMKLR